MSKLVGMATRMASQLQVVIPMGRTVEPGNKEQILKVGLSALWNLSAHFRRNKVNICEEQGSIVFLVELLRSNSVTIVEILLDDSGVQCCRDAVELIRQVWD